MTVHIDFKSMMIGGLLALLLCLLVGAATNERAGQIGRFKITAGVRDAWLVDTATGQVWHANDSVKLSGREFLEPKLPGAAALATGQRSAAGGEKADQP